MSRRPGRGRGATRGASPRRGRGAARRLALCAALLVGCGCGAEPAPGPAGPAARDASRPLRVAVVHYPLRYFAERIGGERVDVSFPAPPGVDPAHWTPTPEQVAAYQRADLVLLHGGGWAGWVQRASLPPSRLVDTSAGFRHRLPPRRSGVAHTHGPRGAHAHPAAASASWLDPRLAAEQARAVAAAFSAARPDAREHFEAGLGALEADLRALDARLEAAARALDGAPLLFSHPVYDALVQRYSLNARSLAWEPDAPPGAAAWRALEAQLEEHAARWLLWEAAPLPQTAQRLEALGVRSAVFAPCGSSPREGDFLALMRRNAAVLEATAPPG